MSRDASRAAQRYNVHAQCRNVWLVVFRSLRLGRLSCDEPTNALEPPRHALAQWEGGRGCDTTEVLSRESGVSSLLLLGVSVGCQLALETLSPSAQCSTTTYCCRRDWTSQVTLVRHPSGCQSDRLVSLCSPSFACSTPTTTPDHINMHFCFPPRRIPEHASIALQYSTFEGWCRW